MSRVEGHSELQHTKPAIKGIAERQNPRPTQQALDTEAIDEQATDLDSRPAELSSLSIDVKPNNSETETSAQQRE